MPSDTVRTDRILTAPWYPALAALAVGLAALGLLFQAEARAALGVWQTSTAYGHCFFVLPLALYLAWDRRAKLAGLVPQPVLWPALAALPLTAAWLAAERVGIMEGRQFVAIAAVEVLAVCVLGWRIARAMAAPLAYLVFLVPFGAFLTPALQDITTWFVRVGLGVIGIPHYIDSRLIEIPEGRFYVAEACAGLRFLIAAVAFGVLYAFLMFRSPTRRVVFLLASVAIPIVANGFRALGIVVLGHVLGSAEAAVADHIIYGWVFFSIVILLLVAAGLPFREDHVPYRADPAPAAPPAAPSALALAALLPALLIAAGPAAASWFDRTAAAEMLATPALPADAPSGCLRQPNLVQPNLGQPGDAVAVPGRTVAQYACLGVPLTLTLQAFPAHATSAAILAATRELTAEFSSEDVRSAPFAIGTGAAADGKGSWRLVAVPEPARLTAVALWVDGAPAAGGLSGRLAMARDSVLGAARPALVAAVTMQGDGQLTAQTEALTTRAMQALLRGLPGLGGA